MNSLKNHFLISVPHLKDPFFEKSVVYLCEHDKKGAMGLIINKAIKKNNITLKDSNSDIELNRYLCLLYTSPSPRDRQKSRMPSSA